MEIEVSMKEEKSYRASPKAMHVLNVAKQVFMQQGYEGASMDGIASEAGVSKATVYSHFKDKSGLYRAIVTELSSQKREAKLQILFNEENRMNLEQGLSFLANDVLCSFSEEGDEERISFLRMTIGESERFPELAKSFVESVFLPLRSAIAEYIKTASKGKIKDPDSAAHIFIGTIIHYSLLYEVLGAKNIIDIDKDALIKSLVKSISNLKS